MALTVLTWNLKGSTPTDTELVGSVARRAGADVVVLQEVQRHQARRLASALGAASWRWGFKHWPVRTWPEGMAVIGVTRRAEVTTRAITRPCRVWSWRRRIMQVADVPSDGSSALLLVNLHLSSHSAPDREREARAVVDTVRRRGLPTVVAGDLNERRGGALAMLLGAGLVDAWLAVHADHDEAQAATNWRRWLETRTGPPNQRLDYLLVSDDLAVDAVWSPRFGEEGFGPLAELSDHLPVAATVSPRPRP